MVLSLAPPVHTTTEPLSVVIDSREGDIEGEAGAWQYGVQGLKIGLYWTNIRHLIYLCIQEQHDYWMFSPHCIIGQSYKPKHT